MDIQEPPEVDYFAKLRYDPAGRVLIPENFCTIFIVNALLGFEEWYVKMDMLR